MRWDGTVRNAEEYIVQFAYGLDYMDASKMEAVKLPIVKMSNDQMLKTYQLSDRDIQKLDLVDIKIDTWKQVNDVELEELFQWRDQLRRAMSHPLIPSIDNTIHVTVFLDRLINTVKTMHLPTIEDVMLTPFTIRTMIQMCCDEIEKHGSNETFYLRAYIKSTLSIRNCMIKYKLTASELEWLIDSIQEKFVRGKVSAGEMVGTIAACSVGEPCTQMSVHPDTGIWIKEVHHFPNESPITLLKAYTIKDFCLQIFDKGQPDHNPVTDTTTASTSIQGGVLPGSTAVDYWTLSVSNTGQIEWKPVTGVTQHPPNGDMIRVTTSHGRSVEATCAKSWLVKSDDDTVVAADGSAIKMGVELPVARRLNYTVTAPATILPLEHVYPLHDPSFPSHVPISADLAFLFGCYVSPNMEACGTAVYAYHPSKQCLSRILTYLTTQLHCPQVKNEDSCVGVASRSAVKMFHYYADTKWPNVHVPSFVFEQRETVVAYLDGLFCFSMATTAKDMWSQLGLHCVAPTEEFLHSLLFLLGLCNIVPDVVQQDTYHICIREQELKRLHNQMTFTWPDLENFVTGMSQLCRSTAPVCHPDLEWDPIHLITTVKPDYPYVYDLTVADNFTFFVADGIGMMDTLNTFHLAGIANKGMTLGVPRFKEIVDGSKNQKTPQVTTYLLPPLNQNDQLTEHFKEALIWTPLYAVVEQSDVVWSPLQQDVDPECEDYELLKLNQPFIPFADPDPAGASGYVIRFVLDQDIMMDKGFEPVDVARRVKEYLKGHGQVIYSETNMMKWIIRVRLAQVKDMADRVQGPDRKHIEKSIMQKKHQELLNEVIVTGIEGVTGADLRRVKKEKVCPKTGELIMDEEWTIMVNGAVLQDMLQLEGVDTTRTISNNPNEVARIFGIEVAVNIIFHEIQKVLSFEGTYVNHRHLLLLVDTMTHRGFIMPMSRHGINRVDFDLLLKASFEESVEILLEGASCKERVSTAEAVTANIILGQKVPMGTGSVCVIDPYTGREIEAKKSLKDIKDDLQQSLYTGMLVETQIGQDLDFQFYNPDLGGSSFRFIPVNSRPPKKRKLQLDSTTVPSNTKKQRSTTNNRQAGLKQNLVASQVHQEHVQVMRLGRFAPSTPQPDSPAPMDMSQQKTPFYPSTPPPDQSLVDESGAVNTEALQGLLSFVNRITQQ